MIATFAKTTIGKFVHRLSLKQDPLYVLAITINLFVLQIIGIGERMEEMKVK